MQIDCFHKWVNFTQKIPFQKNTKGNNILEMYNKNDEEN